MEDRSDAEAAQVEVATFRSDTSYSRWAASRRRGVLENAAGGRGQRRDFTINALLLDPANGEMLDFVGGREDLRAGMIRAIGEPERRFEEDKLRMMRAVRFAARFGYAIEPRNFRSNSEAGAGDSRRFPPERIREELTKILTEGAARRGFELLDETGLLVEVLPEIARMKGVEQPPQFHPEGDVWIHTLMMLEGLQRACSRDAWRGACCCMTWGSRRRSRRRVGPNGRIRFDRHVEVGAKMAEEICRRFRFSNEETEQIAALVTNHMRFKDVPQMKPATLKRFVRLDRFDEHLELHRLDCLSSHRNLDNYDCDKFLAETPPEEVAPPRVLTGDDLIATGVSGPARRSKRS